MDISLNEHTYSTNTSCPSKIKKGIYKKNTYKWNRSRIEKNNLRNTEIKMLLDYKKKRYCL